MRDDEIARSRVRQFGMSKCVDIAGQQGQTIDIARDPPCIAGIEVGDPCFKNGAGQPQGDVPRGSPDDHLDRMRGARQHSLSPLPDHSFTARVGGGHIRRSAQHRIGDHRCRYARLCATDDMAKRETTPGRVRAICTDHPRNETAGLQAARYRVSRWCDCRFRDTRQFACVPESRPSKIEASLWELGPSMGAPSHALSYSR